MFNRWARLFVLIDNVLYICIFPPVQDVLQMEDNRENIIFQIKKREIHSDFWKIIYYQTNWRNISSEIQNWIKWQSTTMQIIQFPIHYSNCSRHINISLHTITRYSNNVRVSHQTIHLYTNKEHSNTTPKETLCNPLAPAKGPLHKSVSQSFTQMLANCSLL